MTLEPVPDTPAIILRSTDTWVCVADLHIGIEARLRLGGFNIPSQTPKMLSKLEELAKFGKRLLIMGDLKHRIPSVGYRENKEIGPFLERLMERYDSITLITGNHDGGISSVLPEKVHALPGRGTKIGQTGFCHGHVWPSESVMEAEQLVMGHTHPSVLLTDTLGAKTNEKCWVRGKLKKEVVLRRYRSCPAELVIVPAFNPLLTGTPVNYRTGPMIGPIFRNGLVNEKSLNTYLLDGTNLGRI